MTGGLRRGKQISSKMIIYLKASMKLDKKTSWRRRTKRSEAMKHVPEKTLAAQ
ncbi:hypothetical protein Csa_001931, partial [Cucumis sativus]